MTDDRTQEKPLWTYEVDIPDSWIQICSELFIMDRPHIRSPGGWEMSPSPFEQLLLGEPQVLWDYRWTLKWCNSISCWNSPPFNDKKLMTKEHGPEAKPSPPQQWGQDLYLTVVGIVGAAAQEHFQWTSKADWDWTSSLASNVSGHSFQACGPPLFPPTPDSDIKKR